MFQEQTYAQPKAKLLEAQRLARREKKESFLLVSRPGARHVACAFSLVPGFGETWLSFYLTRELQPGHGTIVIVLV